MVKGVRNLVIIVSLVCMCVSGCLIPVVAARDAFAPSWLKEGTFAKYEPNTSRSSNLGSVQFFNVTDPKYAGTNYTISHAADTFGTISSSFTWHCISINDTMAKLQVTLDYVGNSTGDYDDNFEYVTNSSGIVSFQLTGVAYVDLYTRGVYNADGVFLGTTHLWLPANPNNGQEVILWEEDSKTITSAVTIDQTTGWTITVQGKQDIFLLSETRVKDKYTLGNPFYDSDTGLYVGAHCCWDPIFAVIGVSSCNVGVLTETNISLGPERSAINWMQILPYVIIPVAVILLVATLLIKRRRKN